MTDIAKKLLYTKASDDGADELMDEAAAEIARLQANLRLAWEKFAEVMDENERLRAALSALKPAT